MSNYASGRRAEHEIVHLLEAVGYDCCRSAGSKGEFDIIATHPVLGIRKIQAKYGKKVSKAEREMVMESRQPTGVSKEIWWRAKGSGSWIVEVL